MTRVERYLTRAAFCQERAVAATDPEVARQFFTLSQQWLYLAQQDEAHHRHDVDYSRMVSELRM